MNINMIELLAHFEKGNTLRLIMNDDTHYIVNNAQYRKKDFLRMVSKIKEIHVLWINE